ncbi:unnamed protein product [Protopolystoma xenopodis]|uniref:Uncharacterized protein n=1 Tax=Protopolystoma xenopodis TaxID=117903 RepID=A0A3S4ZW00_9PLAT|nr:unnamed protein product [Protopolystoma xenopodis]
MSPPDNQTCTISPHFSASPLVPTSTSRALVGHSSKPDLAEAVQTNALSLPLEVEKCRADNFLMKCGSQNGVITPCIEGKLLGLQYSKQIRDSRNSGSAGTTLTCGYTILASLCYRALSVR